MAAEMFAECLAEGQAARRVPSEDDAATVRAHLRGLDRDAEVPIQTARMDFGRRHRRLDAAIWQEDAATMRRKPTHPRADPAAAAPFHQCKRCADLGRAC
jgi:hypothetical protein